MKRGESYGGGKSSLGYLFGSDGEKQKKEGLPLPLPSPTNTPPYATDIGADKKPVLGSPSDQASQDKISNNYPRADGQNSGNFITGRPSTKVNSVPGGDSSLSYLFEDN